MADELVAVPWEGADPSSPTPAGLEVRGFGLYVGVDGDAAHAAGVDIPTLVDDVRRAVGEVPGAATFASVVLAPEGADIPPLDAVRSALGEPSLQRPAGADGAENGTARGLVIDLARHRVTVDGSVVALRYREETLLAHLVRHRGEVHERPALQAALRAEGADEVSGRTIDVYLQRLRTRLAPYGDVIRTVRGRGYRLDPHPDVVVVDLDLTGS